MKTVLVYDSFYGNTEQIAQIIADTLKGDVTLNRVNEAKIADVHDADLVIVGSPTHGGRPTPAVDEYLKKLPKHALKGKKIAAFDTRFAQEEHGIGLRILMTIIRFAAERIQRTLILKGGKSVGSPLGIIVEDKRGPLKNGEMERTAKWAKSLI